MIYKFLSIGKSNQLNIKIFVLSIFLSSAIFILLKSFNFDSKIILITLLLPLITILLFNFNTLKYLFLLSLFTNYFLFGLYLSVFIALSLLPAFLLSYRKINLNILNTPLTIPVLIYYAAIIPSIFNSSNILLTLYLTLNLHAIVILLFILGYTLKDYKDIRKILLTFVVLVTFDALNVIFLALTKGGRTFGFSGVVFVDYSAILIVPLLIMLLFDPSKNKKLFSIAIIIILTGLIFSQTRNSFISLILTFLSVFVFIIFKSDKFRLHKGKIIRLSLSSIILGAGLIYLLTVFTPDSFKRFEELNKGKTVTIRTEDDLTTNSLLTRLLIWDTAINAFNKHPIIGIGIYSFPFESKHFYTISKRLYKSFVEGLSPHVTFIANLAETGLIGFLGFLILLGSSIITTFRSVNLAKTEEQKYYSLIILTLQVYIFYSMFLSDAWLWGQCGMLWGLVMGVSIANFKIITNSKP